ncbi:hypothetical protein [Desulfotignum phosphitoxidans]|uniref:Hydrogenase expression/formation protein, HupF/HypC family n=1 Tax=Desulfotignum phosphitoxidans DSM 13687 TaxID=1286635 RepID=S0FWY9_9BACT|nr:hypothetical protein [Desulfotignum phosphitoxidans]EMS79220.1 hydrogenase expression/formation protein, HupF/HypC family [Desulfotignum phosphitoxidans DSM 13687]
MNVFDQLIKHRPENLVTGTVLAVDNNGTRAKVRVQGETTVWASCLIDVEPGDTVIIYNGAPRSVLQRLATTSAGQVTLVLV